jgi:hypothetical protein
MKYELIENEFGITIKATDENGTELWIPANPANSDYQRYLAQLEGKEPTLPEILETPEAE